MTEEERNAHIDECGRLGFGAEEVALLIEVPIAEVMEDWDEQGPIYRRWQRARLLGEMDVRRSVMDAAREGNGIAINQMLDYYNNEEE